MERVVDRSELLESESDAPPSPDVEDRIALDEFEFVQREQNAKDGAAPEDDEIHLYVARSDPSMGARRRAHSSYLTDSKLDDARFRSPAFKDDEAPGSAIASRGTLTGLATASAFCLAAGYRFSDLRMAPYSSSGPTRGVRVGPDYACATDISATVPGVRATGVRSGTTVRLIGTSAASPQLGRLLANDDASLFGPLPTGSNPVERVGHGLLTPEGRTIGKH